MQDPQSPEGARIAPATWKRRAVGWGLPLALAALPTLLLAAQNSEQVEGHLLLAPIVLSMVLAALLVTAWWCATRRLDAAALLAAGSLFAIFAHGHIQIAVRTRFHWIPLANLNLALFLLWGIGLVALWRFVHGPSRNLAQVANFLTAAVLVMIFVDACQLLADATRAHAAAASPPAAEIRLPTVAQRVHEPLSELPDIYYIILDGYARQDRLQEVYGFDNSPFIQQLEAKGFFVAQHAIPNYAMTYLSLASSLNMRYLDKDVETVDKSRSGQFEMAGLIRNNFVARYLKAQGYRIVHFNTNWTCTERSDLADESFPVTLSEFHRTLIRTTMLEPVISWLAIPTGANLLLYQFDKLKEMPSHAGPKFTFAHIICPHPPFYFDHAGNRISNDNLDWSDRDAYVEQLRFVNKKVIEAVDVLLSRSSRPPIIILQGDHGSAVRATQTRPSKEQPALMHERMAILNAYYVPPEIRARLYSGISPVNSFRIVFSGLFGASFEQLPDRANFSWYDCPYDFTEFTDSPAQTANRH